MRLLKIGAAAIAIAAGALGQAGSAQADGHRWHGDGGYHSGWHGDRGYYNHDRFGTGFGVGFGTGALLGGFGAFGPGYGYGQSYYGYAPTYGYYAPPVYYARPVYRAPVYGAPVYRASYSYCATHYRSFNPRTGLFIGRDGRYHACR